MANTIKATAQKGSTIIWHDPTDWEMRMNALLVSCEDPFVSIQQGENYVEIHKEMIDDLIKLLKTLR